MGLKRGLKIKLWGVGVGPDMAPRHPINLEIGSLWRLGTITASAWHQGSTIASPSAISSSFCLYLISFRSFGSEVALINKISILSIRILNTTIKHKNYKDNMMVI